MIHVVRASEDYARESQRFESTFVVDCELALSLIGSQLSYEVVPVAPYEKTYERDEAEAAQSCVTFLACVGTQAVGRIDLSHSWNGFAYINDLVVEKTFRRSGVGSALVARAIEWSQAERFPGVMLETQNNNVAACKLCERCGFRLSGFDRDLYRGQDSHTKEVALFWYWHSSARFGHETPNPSIERTVNELRPSSAAHAKR